MVKAYSNSAYSSYDGYVSALNDVYEKELEKVVERRETFDSGVPYYKIDGSQVTAEDFDAERESLVKTRIDPTVQVEHVFAKVIVDALVEDGASMPEIYWKPESGVVTLGWYSDVVEVTVNVSESGSCDVRQMDFMNFNEEVFQPDALHAISVIQPLLEVFNENE